MILLIIYFLIPKIQTISAQFPNHVDLHKVGEVKFNNEKYNVLRPTLHVVQDYFHDFMMRRDNNNFPTKRVFIDQNGFRHYWSGFEDVENNLRKTDTLIHQTNTTSTASNATVKEVVYKNGNDKNNRTSTRKLPKRKKKHKFKTRDILREAATNFPLGKTVAKTSFFCPFFGVVTMTTLLD